MDRRNARLTRICRCRRSIPAPRRGRRPCGTGTTRIPADHRGIIWGNRSGRSRPDRLRLTSGGTSLQNMSMLAKRLVVLCLAPLLAACYMERPLTTPVPQSATRIVAALTDTGSLELAKVLGQGAREV